MNKTEHLKFFAFSIIFTSFCEEIFSSMTQLKEQKKVATASKTFNENKFETRNMHIKYLTKINCNSEIQNDFTVEILSKYICHFPGYQFLFLFCSDYKNISRSF